LAPRRAVNLFDLFAIAGRRAPGRIALRMPPEAEARPPAMPPAVPPAAADAGAVVGTALAWSYEELLGRAAALAAGLERWGLRRGDRVACILGNGSPLVLLHLALLHAGAVLVPLNLAYRRREIGHILSDAAPRLVVAETAPRRLVEELPAEQRASVEAILSVEDIESWMGDAAAPRSGRGEAAVGIQAAGFAGAPAAGGDDLAMLLYTSGTTGPSKGAMISHNNLLATVTGLLAAWGWQADDSLLLALPLFHVHGLIVGLDCALAAGARVELRRRFDAAAVIAELEAGAATMFFGVPTLYVRLVEELRRLGAGRGAAAGEGGGGMAALRLFCSGSAPLPPDVFAAFRALTGHVILERYGMTEAGMILSNPYLGPRLPGEVGTPLPGVSVRVADEAGGDAAPGAVGELLVRGANVFAGYWRAPEKSAASFVGDGAGRAWFRTGDLARQDPASGSYTLLGRRHELILTGGFNVYPREIEETLLAFPGVREAAVAGRPHVELGEVPAAFLVADREPPLDLAALLAFCRDQLAPFKVPRQVTVLEELPRSALGKLQKHLLP
jgi:malonyl-CoA/methylmalonyl-CoA synthetase